ncbi:MAG: hypothetical protein IJK35_06900 [Oscillospiraceae bacterium]|nr:hypothetical protein [Oscillospiraceae bacterium]
MKRLIAFLLCLCLCAALLPAASADSELVLTAAEADGLLTLTLTATRDLVDCCGMRISFGVPEGFAYRSHQLHAGFTSQVSNPSVFKFQMDNYREPFLLAQGEAIFTLTLEVPEGLEPGDYAFSAQVIEAYNWDFDDYTITGQTAETVYTRPFPLPVITQQPQSVTALAGETAVFRVGCDETVTYRWSYRSSPTAAWKACTGTGANTAELPIEAKGYRSGYQYRCEVTGRGGSVTSEAATLTVITAPSFTLQPRSAAVPVGESVCFTVKTSGSAASLQWYYRTSESGAWNKCSNGTAAELTVEAKLYRSGYQYRCRAVNAAGTALSEIVTLTVLDLVKPVITRQPQSAAAVPGVTVSFTVAATDAESYQWYYRTSESGAWTKCSDGTAATLKVEAKLYRSGYQYRCRVSNAAGAVYSEAATLTVAEKPKITAQPASRSVAAGKTVSFTVKAEGAESYQWYFRTSSTGAWTRCSNGTAPTLTVEAKLYRSGYQYRCKVTNASGSVYSSTATLTVK